MWTLDGVRIYVTGFQENGKQIIARLQPLATGTILQTFGYESPIISIQGKVVGETNLNALKSLVTTAQRHTLSGYQYSDSLYVSSVSTERDPYVWQSLDTSQSCYANVYTVTIELYK